MKQVILREVGAPDVLEVVEGTHQRPGPGQVLIETRAIAVSKPDVLMRQGRYIWSPPLPINPGNELTGIAVEVGHGVTSVAVGDSVLLSARELPTRGGCYTEAITVSAAAVHVLPANVDLQEAVVLPTYLVAHAMLNGLGLAEKARSVFVNGATGAVGGALCELAKARGLTVIGSVGSPEKAIWARAAGVDFVLNYRTEPLRERVLECTEGRGVDLAFDHVIGPGILDIIRMLAEFGTVVAYNVFSPMPDEDAFGLLRERSSRCLGLRVFNMHVYDHDQVALRRLTRELIDLLAEGRIRPRIAARLPLSKAADAHRLMEAGELVGKVLLIP